MYKGDIIVGERGYPRNDNNSRNVKLTFLF